MGRQRSFFGVDPDPEVRFLLFHDESGNYVPNGGDRWLVHGVLLVPVEALTQCLSILTEVRKLTNYRNAVHFVALRKSVAGPKGSCVEGWLDAYARIMSNSCAFHALAIDTRSPGFDTAEYSEPHYVYNSFARTAIVGAIAWSLGKVSRVAITIHSHERRRQQSDNFVTYLPGAVFNRVRRNSKRKGARYPRLRLEETSVRLVGTRSAEIQDSRSNESELIQLTDLLTSSVAQALVATSSQRAKLRMADIVSPWIMDTRREPWLQEHDLHRRFSLSCYPDENGNFYDPTLQAVGRNQLTFL